MSGLPSPLAEKQMATFQAQSIWGKADFRAGARAQPIKRARQDLGGGRGEAEQSREGEDAEEVAIKSHKFNYTAMDNDAEKFSVPVETLGEFMPNSSNPVSKVKMLLFRRMLVGISDGRFFLGNFHCMDKQGNIILQDAVEYRSTRRSSPSPMEQRCLGLILILVSCRTSCHVDCSIEEQLSLLSLPG